MQSGIYLIDKAEGLSSAAELSRIKRKLGLRKVGHAGTLDPMATGLLVCLCNSATRLAGYAEKGRKRYSGTIRLGMTTSTDDKNGEVLSECNDIPDFDEVRNRADTLIGEIEQMPPDISAKKVDGERAYRITRRGEKPKLKTKRVTVYSLSLAEAGDNRVSFTVECSSGTYIRSIARDLGHLLGCGGCLESLRREFSFPFDVSCAKSYDSISTGDFREWIELFPNLSKVSFDRSDVKKLVTGDLKNIRARLGDIIENQVQVSTDTVVYFEEEKAQPLGLLRNVSGIWEIAVNLN